MNPNQPLIALTGRSGDGKTTLLGKFVLQMEVSRKSFPSLYIST